MLISALIWAEKVEGKLNLRLGTTEKGDKTFKWLSRLNYIGLMTKLFKGMG